MELNSFWLSTGYCKLKKLSYMIAPLPNLLYKKILFCSDRFRTSVNVLGDSIGCGVVAHLSRHDLKKLDSDKAIWENQDKQVT